MGAAQSVRPEFSKQNRGEYFSDLFICNINHVFSFKHIIFQDLVMKLSDESGLIEDELKDILQKLQSHSISKLEENKRFNRDGIAVFKIKIIGNNNKMQEVSS